MKNIGRKEGKKRREEMNKKKVNNYIIINGEIAGIELTQSKTTIIDIEDLPRVLKHSWHAFKTKNSFYAMSRFNVNGKQKNVLLHRFLLNVTDRKIIDHKSGTLDNRKCNLRICNHSQNAMNMISKTGSSKYKGVHWNKLAKKWVAYIMLDSKKIHLGYFDKDKENEAGKAYNKKAIELFGEFAKLNIIPKAIDVPLFV